METTMLATTHLGHLGPARVTRVDGDRVFVVSDDQERVAVLAMVVRYQPRIDDVLLVASNAETCYAIGVLAGSGSVELTSTGDVTLSAGGRVRIQAQDAVTTDAPLVRTQAGRLELLATDLLASAQSFLQRVAGLLHLQAGRRHTQVEGSSIENARQVVIKAQETVTVDGSTIHLG